MASHNDRFLCAVVRHLNRLLYDMIDTESLKMLDIKIKTSEMTDVGKDFSGIITHVIV